jgi:hypothetical protein
MDEVKKQENDRAARIAFATNLCHKSVSSIYEQTVDREYEPAKDQIKRLIRDLKDLYKSIEEDDL